MAWQINPPAPPEESKPGWQITPPQSGWEVLPPKPEPQPRPWWQKAEDWVSQRLHPSDTGEQALAGRYLSPDMQQKTIGKVAQPAPTGIFQEAVQGAGQFVERELKSTPDIAAPRASKIQQEEQEIFRHPVSAFWNVPKIAGNLLIGLPVDVASIPFNIWSAGVEGAVSRGAGYDTMLKSLGIPERDSKILSTAMRFASVMPGQGPMILKSLGDLFKAGKLSAATIAAISRGEINLTDAINLAKAPKAPVYDAGAAPLPAAEVPKPGPAPVTPEIIPPIRTGTLGIPEERVTPAHPDLRGDVHQVPSPDAPAPARIVAANKRADETFDAARDWVQSNGPAENELATASRNRQIGHRDLWSHKSSQFWDSVGQDLDAMSVGKEPSVVETVGPRGRRRVNLRGQQQKVAEETRSAVSLFLDRMKNPAAFDAKITQAIAKFPSLRPIYERMKGLSPEIQQYAINVINRYDQMRGQFLKDQGVFEDARDWHVTHLWEEGAPATGVVGKRLGGYRFKQERVFEQFTDGIVAGKKPKTLDIVQINAMNDQSVARATFTRELRDALIHSGEAIFSERPVPGMVNLGAGSPIFRAGKETLWMTPEAGRAVQSYVQFDPFSTLPSRGKDLWDRFKELQDFIKLSKLNLSLFHHANLYKGFLTRGFLPDTLTPVAKGLNWLMHGDEYLDLLIKGGLKADRNMTATQDAMIASHKLKFLRPAEKFLMRNPLSTWLWERIHPGLKVYDGVQTLKKLIPKFEGRLNLVTGKPWAVEEIAEHVASVMNDRYGGLNWERTAFSKRVVNTMRRVLFAPDWMMANLRTLWSGTVGAGFDIRAVDTLFATTPRGYLARRNLAAITAIGGAMQEITNKALSGHWTWENEPGRRLAQIDTGQKDQNGRPIYIENPFVPGPAHFALMIAGSVNGVWSGDWTVHGAFSFLWNRLHPVVRAGVELAAAVGPHGQVAGIKSPGSEMQASKGRPGTFTHPPIPARPGKPWWDTSFVKDIAPIPIGASIGLHNVGKGFASIPEWMGLYRTSPSPGQYPQRPEGKGLHWLLQHYAPGIFGPEPPPAPKNQDKIPKYQG